MIDFHSHILPCMDDGASDIQMSVRMVEESKKQGIDILCATSHYYATEESPVSFLKRRRKAYDRLKDYLGDDVPVIKLGAEVQYFEGITRVKEIELMKTEDSNLLLVEMPFSKWSARMIGDVLELNSRPDTEVLLAHVERYIHFNDEDTFNDLLENGVLFQSNASFFLDFFSKKKAMRLLNRGMIQFLGSDCHNMDDRRPRLDDAYSLIEKKLGSEIINEMNMFGHSFFSK